MAVEVRTRYAPSPTGYMHIGNFRTALYEYLIAKSQNGKFILRIEDTDQERYVEGAVDVIYNTLKLTGLKHDEGPDIGGGYGPYVQSRRKHIYLPYAKKLVEMGEAYYCFCTRERLANLREEHEKQGIPHKYDRCCMGMSRDEVERWLSTGEPFIIRQKMPQEGSTIFEDSVFGTITVENNLLEDQVLIKSDGLPTYNFANVIDDHLMKITHVIRGCEYLPSTPKYNLLYNAFGWEIPTYVHLPLITKLDGAKISKRAGDASFEDLVSMGYLVEAIVNYVVLLGWSPGNNQEIFSLKELEKSFDINGISKSPAALDYNKLRWFNAEYIRKMALEEFHEAARPYYEGVIANRNIDLMKVSRILQVRTEVLSEIPEKIDFIDSLPKYDNQLYIHKKMKTDEAISLRSLQTALPVLEGLSDWNEESLHDALMGLAEQMGIKNGQLLWPIRTAITGKDVSPGGAMEIADILGKDETVGRIRTGIEKLKNDLSGSNSRPQSNFIQDIINEDLKTNKHGGRVHTRFPPEPNGYLHIGHAKSICLNFGIAAKNGGLCNLRFDDTNPVKEDVEYVESIQQDVKWLGFDWYDRLFYASDYFDRLYKFAEQLIRMGKAYVCDLSADQIREYRGTLTKAGKESPYLTRSVEENLDLFRRMKAGEYTDGSRVLRAKIDMNSPNLNMRDPVIYRILRSTHHRTGDNWCIYPMYDYAHPLSDYLEGITHSICTLEFEDHRPLYDWLIETLGIEPRPQQIEFARLNLNYTVMSKRKLLELVKNGYVSGWDDPRMPTISGLRRRGFTPESIRDFAERIGVAKTASVVDTALLEHCIREDLNRRAARVMAVLRPLRVVIDNYPEGQVEEFEAENNPEDPGMGSRKVPFSTVIYIEQDDFCENPPKNYFRLSPGGEVRLKYAYIVKFASVVKDEKTGEIIELHCTYDPDSRGGNAPDGRKVKGTLHWVSASHAIDAEVRLYDRLFTIPNPGEEEDRDYKDDLNPNSLETLTSCKVEPSLSKAAPGSRYQFLRMGYFCTDTFDSQDGAPVFNRIVPLKDSWAKAGRS